MIVRLTSGVDYRGGYSAASLGLAIILSIVGLLSCLDGYMNIALEQTEEHVNGIVTNRYGDAFIRGNNGLNISLSVYETYINYFHLVLYISAAEVL